MKYNYTKVFEKYLKPNKLTKQRNVSKISSIKSKNRLKRFQNRHKSVTTKKRRTNKLIN